MLRTSAQSSQFLLKLALAAASSNATDFVTRAGTPGPIGLGQKHSMTSPARASRGALTTRKRSGSPCGLSSTESPSPTGAERRTRTVPRSCWPSRGLKPGSGSNPTTSPTNSPRLPLRS